MRSQKTNKKVWFSTAISAVLVLLTTDPQMASAQQWVTHGNHISNNNIGNVGIGTTSPSRLFHILDSSSSPVFSGARISTTLDGSDPVLEFLHQTANKGFRWRLGNSVTNTLYLDRTSNGFGTFSPLFTVLDTGNVGIGTTSPISVLDVERNSNGLTMVRTGNNNGGPNALAGFYSDVGGNAAGIFGATGSGYSYISVLQNRAFIDANTNLSGIVLNNEGAQPIIFSVSNSERMRVHSSGNVGIGTTTPTTKLHVVGDGKITGNLTVDGNIAAKYQDVAEWVPASEHIAAGTVVVLDSSKSNHVTASKQGYDTRVAGVISEKPGIALGESGDNRVLVATTGRVRIKVDATRGPIHIGDLLVTSNISGMAMKSEPVNIAGVQMHRPGTLIGKALEPMEKGKGEILVLLSLQ